VATAVQDRMPVAAVSVDDVNKCLERVRIADAA
jgi:hypothetical protein